MEAATSFLEEAHDLTILRERREATTPTTTPTTTLAACPDKVSILAAPTLRTATDINACHEATMSPPTTVYNRVSVFAAPGTAPPFQSWINQAGSFNLGAPCPVKTHLVQNQPRYSSRFVLSTNKKHPRSQASVRSTNPYYWRVHLLCERRAPHPFVVYTKPARSIALTNHTPSAANTPPASTICSRPNP